MDEKKSTYNGFTEARARANKKYLSHYVDVKGRVTPEKKALIQKHAASMGESVSAFVNRAIDETIKHDNE